MQFYLELMSVIEKEKQSVTKAEGMPLRLKLSNKANPHYPAVSFAASLHGRFMHSRNFNKVWPLD